METVRVERGIGSTRDMIERGLALMQSTDAGIVQMIPRDADGNAIIAVIVMATPTEDMLADVDNLVKRWEAEA